MNLNNRLDTCGCCEGVETLTPLKLDNPAGLSALLYRVGTHSSFKKSMVAALSQDASLSGRLALKGLSSREDNDPSLALIDAWATVLDVLTFYQERIANEGYLRTATERMSLLELARSIGYELSPGVSASTFLAFELETSVGAPLEASIGIGTKVQSIPEQDQTPQIFETSEQLEAKAAWNGLKPRLRKSQTPMAGDARVYLQGLNLSLELGDGLLFVKDSTREIRRIAAMELDVSNETTTITLESLLQNDADEVYAFRQRAALFGRSAPDWRAMSKEVKEGYLGRAPTATDTDWPYSPPLADAPLNLDNRYNKMSQASYVVIERPSFSEPIVAEVTAVNDVVVTGYTLSSGVTQLELDNNVARASLNDVRQTSLLVESEKLSFADVPIVTALEFQGAAHTRSVNLVDTLSPLGGDEVVLDNFVAGLQKDHHFIVSGKASRVMVKASGLNFILSSGHARTLSSDEILRVTSIPIVTDSGKLLWTLVDQEGIEGLVSADADDLLFTTSDPDSDDIAEVVSLREKVSVNTETQSILKLTGELTQLYDRETVTIYGNVLAASHGETKADVLGSGNAAKAFQQFELKQKPLSFVSAKTSSGTQSTLAIRVNDVLWQEADSRYALDQHSRSYITKQADDGAVTVQFGDGKNGARLPTGFENIKASYRVGTGSAGLLNAGQLSLLMTRPLGVKGVKSPLAPSGAQDPETRDAARQNAPLTILTLERIVSLQDYEDFTRAFAGIGKAQATQLWQGETRLVHITVAAADGSEVRRDSELYSNLIDAITAASPPRQQVLVDSYTALNFKLSATLTIDKRFISEDIIATVHETLLDSFSFEKRSFAHAVAASEVMAVMQSVDGVVAVDLNTLYLDTPLEISPLPPIAAKRASWDSATQTALAAELLTLDPHGLDLGVVQA